MTAALGEARYLRRAGKPMEAAESFDGIPREQPENFEALALKLARDPAALPPLLGTACIARNLEFADATMWERGQRGLPPATFTLEGASPS